MKILYFGNNSPNSTSFHRACALNRIGHDVEIINPYPTYKSNIFNKFFNKLNYHSGYFLLSKKINKFVLKIISKNFNFDLIWVDSGELFGVECLKILKSSNRPVILYNIDDPTGNRDGNRFRTLIKALPFYSLVVVVRKESKDECLKLGAKNVLLVNRSYDEEAHKSFENICEIKADFFSDVAFIGTWMRNEKRDDFILKLINSEIDVAIWGDRWEKSKNWNKIKPYYKGKSLGGREYVAAIQGAKICIGMLSKGNRDLHTQRSLEIPFAGGLLCAERTSEHLNFYKEGEEALFWDDSNECIEICKTLLNNHILREQIRKAGNIRVKLNKVGNEDICQTIIDEIISIIK
jgi:spore maturation protein CgeB